MASATPLPLAAPGSAGVGELKLDAAALVTAPPNPNARLNRFLVADPLGGPTPMFDAASWAEAAGTDAAWDSASWADASWADGETGKHTWPDLVWLD
jgi:hypothetical protein